LFGSARLLHTIEEHGGGKQLARFRMWPQWSRLAVCAIGSAATIGVVAIRGASEAAGMLVLFLAGVVMTAAILNAGAAIGIVGRAALIRSD